MASRPLSPVRIGFKVLLLFALAMGPVASRDTDHCYADNDHPYLKFGTRTAYHVVQGGNTSYQKIPNCEPVQIWMLVRHGTRYPGEGAIRPFKLLYKFRDQIIRNHIIRGRGRLCDLDLKNLNNWHLDPGLTPESAGKLTRQGIADMDQLGKRVKSNFPELFPPVTSNVSSANYKFRAARMDRMNSSMMTLISGIFDTDHIPDPDVADEDLFQINSKCPRWKSEVDDNSEIRERIRSFRKSPEYQAVMSNVSQRLGYRYNLRAATVQLMWDMCRYDKAWRTTDLSPWCAIFSDWELKVLEYREDIYDYYHRGPGHDFNARLGCPQLRDMLQHFEKLESADYSAEPKGVFNVARSGSVHLFMAAMGVARESAPLLAADFNRTSDRRWRTSEIGTFATNIAAVFYKCNGTKSTNKVMFYLSEKPMDLEGCHAGLCDWEYLKGKYQGAVVACGPHICQLHDPALAAVTFSLIWFSMLMIGVLCFRRIIRVVSSSWLRLHKKVRNRMRFRFKILLRPPLQIV